MKTGVQHDDSIRENVSRVCKLIIPQIKGANSVAEINPFYKVYAHVLRCCTQGCTTTHAHVHNHEHAHYSTSLASCIVVYKCSGDASRSLTCIVQDSSRITLQVSGSKQLHDSINLLSLSRKMETDQEGSVEERGGARR